MNLKNKRLKYIVVNLITAIMPILILPYIARIISVEDFGVYAIYFGVISILGSIANLSLNNSFFKVINKSDRISLIILNVIVVFITITIFFIGTFIFQKLSSNIIDNIFIYSGLISLLSIGLLNTFHSFFLSIKCYNLLSRVKFFSLIFALSCQLFFVKYYSNVYGLVYSNMLALLFNLLLFLIALRNVKFIFNYYKVIDLLKANKSLLGYTTLSSLSNNIASYTPEFLIGIFFGIDKTGLYNMAVKIISTPLSFLSSSVQDIFKEKISRTNNQNIFFKKFALYLYFFSILCFMINLIFIDTLVISVLGNKWEDVIVICNIIIIMHLSKFINGPLSFIWLLRNKEKKDFQWQLIYIFLIPLSIIVSVNLDFGFIKTLLVFSLVISMHYVYAITLSYRYLNEK